MGLLQSMEWDNMDDTGMYVWSLLLTVVAFAIAWANTLWYQRWRKKRSGEGSNPKRPENE